MNAHAPSAGAAPADTAPTAPTPEDVPRGCAWFDSSLDLQQGLRVRELDAADPRCGGAFVDAFLDGWLAWVMAAPSPGGCRPQA
jgi:hypothetical protein